MNKIRMFTVPNAITLSSLACGCMAIVAVSTTGIPIVAFWLIAAGAVLDFLDGMAARMLRQYSDIGKQLDSLSDMVTFGVAPSLMLFYACIHAGGGTVISLLCFLPALSSALRLARFNIDQAQTVDFRGLPTPASALTIISVCLADHYAGYAAPPYFLVSISLILSILMVSPVPMASLKLRPGGLKSNIRAIIYVLTAILTVVLFGVSGIAVAIMLYIMVSLAEWVLSMARKSQHSS